MLVHPTAPDRSKSAFFTDKGKHNPFAGSAKAIQLPPPDGSADGVSADAQILHCKGPSGGADPPAPFSDASLRATDFMACRSCRRSPHHCSGTPNRTDCSDLSIHA